MTGFSCEPAQLSYANGDAPGGVSGFEPQRSATQTDSPSLSIPTAFSAPHVRPAGSFPHLLVEWYGVGASLVGFCSSWVYTVPTAIASNPIHTLVSTDFILMTPDISVPLSGESTTRATPFTNPSGFATATPW